MSNDDVKKPAPWQGELWIGDVFAVFFGTVGDNKEHAHYAHQAVRPRSGLVRMDVNGNVVEAPWVVVATKQRHRIVSAPQPSWVAYAEPMAVSVERLQAVMRAAPNTTQAICAGIAAVRSAPHVDLRVADLLARIDGLLEGKVRAAQLAGQARLSLSQLERLFAAQVGLSVRRLVLWRRMRLAVELASRGGTLTEAAHQAGFADSAHLSRTVKSMFGVRADRGLLQLRAHKAATR